MFIVKALDDGTAEKYETLEQIYMHCEGIDVDEGMYEFTDDDGNFYDVVWAEKVVRTKRLFFTSLTQGKYTLAKRIK